LRLQHAAGAAVGRAGEAPTVRVGITDEQAEAYLPDVLPGFTSAHPDARLQVVCDLSPNLVGRLRDGDLDLALVIRHLGDPSGGETIAIEELVWIAGADAALDAEQAVPLVVNPEGCTYRARALDALTQSDRAWQVMYESESPTGLNVAVACGLGIGIKAARSVPPGCRVVEAQAGLPVLPPAVVQLHRAPTAVSPAHDGFADRLVAAVREQPGNGTG
jgi:DNA-binding transcriptional LysR family regulator